MATSVPLPYPRTKISHAQVWLTAVICQVLISFSMHMDSAPEQMYLAVQNIVYSYWLWAAALGTKKIVLDRIPLPIDPPMWRPLVVISGMLLALAIQQGLDRTILGAFAVAHGLLDASDLQRFNDAGLIVRAAVVIASVGIRSAQISYRRLEATQLSEALAQREAAESKFKVTELELQRQLARADAERSRQLATEAELTALKMQINPHFLFNTLSSISVLSRIDGVQAGVMAEKLAEMFRYALQASKRPTTTLGEEVTFLEDYFEIEKARFGDRLTLEVDIPGELFPIAVPNLLLQPIVENAIKHAFKGMCRGGRVAVTAAERAGVVEISVADNGRGFGDDEPRRHVGKGTALKNIDQRLRRLFGEERGLILENRPEGGAQVRVRVPLLVGQEDPAESDVARENG